MMRTILLVMVLLLVAEPVLAQTAPQFTTNGRPSKAGDPISLGQTLSAFAGKADNARLDAVAAHAQAAEAGMPDADNVVARGADGTGVSDATSTLRLSQASGKTVYLPAGRYRLTDTLTLSPGQCLVGEGRTRSVIKVGADFNPGAAAIIVAAAVETGACIHDVGIEFAQPNDQGSRASFKTLAQSCSTGAGGSGCKYPPAIIAPGAARAQFERVRISGAWDGVILTGNAGGLLASDLEVGALNTGLFMDGGLDFCHVSGYHFWPFGLATGALYTGVFSDGFVTAANLGQCDDWDIRGLSSFMGQVNLLANATQGGIVNLLLDGDNANLNIFGGFWNISNLTSTKGTTSPNPAITVTGGATTITGVDLRSTSPNALIFQSGGILKVAHGRVNQNNVTTSAVLQTGGRMALDGLNMAPGAGVWTQPYVSSTATEFSLRNSSWDQKGASTGTGVQLGVDSIADYVQGNDFGGWGFVPFGGGTIGTYGPNKVGVFGFTPSLHPTTPGTWAPSYSLQNGRYWYRGDGIEFEMHLVFSTNAYAGAAGGMVITGLPFASAPSSNAAGDGNTTAVTSQSNVALDAGYTGIVVQMQSPPTNVVLSESGAGVPLTGMGAGSFPPSRAGFELSLHGFIPTN